MGRQDYETETILAFSAKDYGADASDIAPTLRAGSHSGSHANGAVMPAVAFAQNSRDEVREMSCVGALSAEPGMKQTSYIRQAGIVRRLTPLECERLQGFPDDYTLVPYRGKAAVDGPRYKALGNSMAVPVMRWIGERIAQVEAIEAQRIAA
jgi:DNA (cytosine-5)-methyltransferase 1